MCYGDAMDHANGPAPAADRLGKLLRMLEAEPSDPFCLYGIAQEHARAGRHAEAVAWYDRTIAADPSHSYAYFHRAKSLEAEGRDGEARETLRAGIDAARRGGDRHALSELSAYLDELT